MAILTGFLLIEKYKYNLEVLIIINIYSKGDKNNASSISKIGLSI